MGVALQSDEDNLYDRRIGGYFPSCVGKAVDLWTFSGSAAASRKGLVNGVQGSFVSGTFDASKVTLEGSSAYFDTLHSQAAGAFGYALVTTIPDNTIYVGNYATAGGAGTFDNLARTTGAVNVAIKGQNRNSIAGTYTGLRMIAGTWDGVASVIPYLSSGGSLIAGSAGIYEGDNAPVSTVKVAGRSGGASQDAVLFWLFEDAAPTGPEMQELWEWSKEVVEGLGNTFG